MANSVLHTAGYTPSSNEFTTVYAAPEGVEYVEVLMVQCGNTGSVERNVSVRWTAWENKLPASGGNIYYGDGITIDREVWDYSPASSMIVNEALIPGKAALSVLDSTIFLGPATSLNILPNGNIVHI